MQSTSAWKQRFRVDQVLWARVAQAAPARGLVVTNPTGVYQLHAWDVATGELRQLTQRPEGVLDGRISPDGRFVYYLADQQGSEIGHLVRVPFEGGEPQDLTPDLPPYANFGCALSRAGNLLAFSLAARGIHQVCCIPLGPGDVVGGPRVLHQSTHELWLPVLSHDGGLLVVPSTARAQKRQPSLLAFDTTTGNQLAELWDGPGASLGAVMFAGRPGDSRLLGSSNRTGMERPLIWDVRTGKRIDLPLPDLEGEVYPVDWAEDGERILLRQIIRAITHLHVYHLCDHQLRQVDHPPGTLWPTYFMDGEIFTGWQDSTHPACLIVLNPKSGRQTQMLLPAGAVPGGRPWRSVTFPSSDGQKVQGWLGVPAGQVPFPTILEIHGGPQAMTPDFFLPRSQMWLDHGFAYLSINYRGSTTFGRAFEEQIWGHPGDWELEDLVAARTWLVAQGIARPDRILLTGRSYGGYLTLLALGRRPDLWAGGMAMVAVCDFRRQYEDASEPLRQWVIHMLGGTPEERPDQYRVSSPITYAEHVRAPLLLIQGRHDTRPPARQAEAYIAKMQLLGKPIEVHWFDEGHVAGNVERMIEDAERMLQFAQRVCGDPEERQA